jgi:hypothetical protein
MLRTEAFVFIFNIIYKGVSAMYRWYFKPKNIKKIPLKHILLWLFLTALLVLLFAEMFASAPKRFDSAQEKQITVERIGFQGHRNKNLIIYTKDEAYYISTSSFRVRDSVRKIDNAWENGTISSGDTLTVQYVDGSRVPFRKNLIVGLQTEDTVYYELDTAKKVAAEERFAIIASFFLILLFWITITLLTLYTDDIVGIRRLTKSERKRMREKGK